ncbi:hypothetical protein ABW20_dc0107594 [Dactylellina cionopaga]|nr:hypothetical protein ABW20_dc0107594 [Dactylellina cionopaga]
MFIHLESGACDSTISYRDIFRTFAIHTAADLLLVTDRKGVLKRMFEGEDPECSPFQCPGRGTECGETFKFFSGFLQHTETGKCGFTFKKSGDSSMLVHMEKHLFIDVAISRISKMEMTIRSGMQVLVICPEHPKERKNAYLPDADELRGYFTNISRNIQICLKEVSYNTSVSAATPGYLKVRIPRAFARDMEQLERVYYKALNKYNEDVTDAPRPHGDILIYFQATKTSFVAWKFLKEVQKLVRVFRVLSDSQMA